MRKTLYVFFFILFFFGGGFSLSHNSEFHRNQNFFNSSNSSTNSKYSYSHSNQSRDLLDSIKSFLDSIDLSTNDENFYDDFSCKEMYETFYDRFGCFYSEVRDSFIVDSIFNKLIEVCHKGFSYKDKKLEYLDISENYAKACIYLKRFQKAEEIYLELVNQRSLTIDEYGNAQKLSAYMNIADFYASIGNFENAKTYYRKYIDFIQNDEDYIESILSDKPFVKRKEFDYALVELYTKTIYLDLQENKKSEAYHHIDTCVDLILKQIDFALTKEIDVENFEYLYLFENLVHEFNGFIVKYFNKDNQIITKVLTLNMRIKGFWYELDRKENELAAIFNADRNLLDQYKKAKKDWFQLNKNPETVDSNIDVRTIEKTFYDLRTRVYGLMSPYFTRKDINIEEILDVISDNEAIVDFIKFNENSRSSVTQIDRNLLCRSENHLSENFIYDSYFAVVLKRNRSPELIKLCSDSILKGFIPDCDNRIRPNTSNYTTSMRKSKELYNLIWRKMETSLKGIVKIFISPAGELFNISFAALAPKDSTYLIDIFDEIVYIRNIEDMIEINSNSFIPEDISDQIAVLFGGMIYDLDSLGMLDCSKKSFDEYNNLFLTDKSKNIQLENFEESIPDENFSDIIRGNCLDASIWWEKLPSTLNEVKNIKVLFDKQENMDCLIYTDSIATEESLKLLTNNKSPFFLHISTHGFYNQEQINGTRFFSEYDYSEIFSDSGDFQIRSGLIMTGGNWIFKNNKPIQWIDDGVLTESEISHMNLKETFLLILSACETGLGEIGSGNEIWGLQRAFSVSGVQNLILTLWRVQSKSTSDFMIRFYFNLLVNKKSISKALIDTQREFRWDKSTGEYLSAFIWAPFVLIQ